MNERDTTPDKLVALKEAILTAFHALPPEHQATMSLVILGKVMEGEWGDWTHDAINRLYPPYQETATSSLSFPDVTREQLRQTTINSEDVDTLTDDDLTTIATNMHTHYVNDLFWDEVQFHTENFLDTKHGSAHSSSDPQSRTTDTTD